jgi:hypothetical protein
MKVINKKANGGSIRRAKPMTPKVSVSRSGKRRYGCGGSMKKK